MNEGLKEIIQLALEGQIWRLFYDHSSGQLLIELRKKTAKEICFIAINLHNGQSIRLDFMEELSWWLGVSAFRFPYIILHTYPEPTIPQSAGVICYDVLKGTKLWQNLTLQFIQLDQASILAYSLAKQENVQVDLILGEILQSSSKNSHHPNDPFIRKYVHSPDVYQDTDDGFLKIKEFINKKLEVDIVKTLEYLEFTQYIIISFYIYGINNLVLYNTLVVFSNKGELLLQEELAANKKGTGLNTFTVFNKSLVFIKNSSQIAVYELG